MFIIVRPDAIEVRVDDFSIEPNFVVRIAAGEHRCVLFTGRIEAHYTIDGIIRMYRGFVPQSCQHVANIIR